MRLLKKDEKILLALGYPQEDLCQIQKSLGKRNTTYTYIKGRYKLSRDEVLDMMDRKEFLSAVARSTYHGSAIGLDKKGEQIYFRTMWVFPRAHETSVEPSVKQEA